MVSHSGIEKQLQKILSRPAIRARLFDYLKRPSGTRHDPHNLRGGVVGDVWDGTEFKDWLATAKPHDATATWGTRTNVFELFTRVFVDAAQAYQKTSYSVTGFYMAIENLPPHMRHKKKNLILLGVLPGTSILLSSFFRSHLVACVCE